MNHIPSIHFFSESTSFVLRHKRKIRSWIISAILNEGRKAGEINFIFCSDAYLHKMNVEYLDHDTLTDIITFDMSEEDSVISGEIFISVDRAKENARKFKVRYQQEITRLMIHGTLHLIGFGDKTKDEKSQMTGKEDYYLSLLP